jgi:uncharacterized membrane protein
MTKRQNGNAMVAAGALSLAVGVERMLNAAFVESLVSPSTRLIVAAGYTAAGSVMLVLGASRNRRGREETGGRTDS